MTFIGAGTLTKLINHFSEPARVEWHGDRPFAFSRLRSEYTSMLEELALEREAEVKTLPITPGWEPIADKNPTTARYSRYSAFLISPLTLALFFAIRETYTHLLQALGQDSRPRFIQCWYNIHRGGESLVRHKHPYPFIGTFSAHAAGSQTRYGKTRETSDADLVVEHVDGLLMITTGEDHYHETSVWEEQERPRVTYAFDILNAERWNAKQVFVPFDF